MKSVSCSDGFHWPSLAFSQVQASETLSVSQNIKGHEKCQWDSLADRTPHWQVSPSGLTFSALDRSQLHSPAGRERHEQRAPTMVFSMDAFSHVQCRADC